MPLDGTNSPSDPMTTVEINATLLDQNAIWAIALQHQLEQMPKISSLPEGDDSNETNRAAWAKLIVAHLKNHIVEIGSRYTGGETDESMNTCLVKSLKDNHLSRTMLQVIEQECQDPANREHPAIAALMVALAITQTHNSLSEPIVSPPPHVPSNIHSPD